MLLRPDYLFTGKHRLWAINGLLLIGIGYTLATNSNVDIYQSMIIFLFISPFFLLFKPKIIKSYNILFMSLYTYFTIPFAFNLIIAERLRAPIPIFLVFIFITTLLIFTFLHLYYRKRDRETFLNHSKISLDIVRFVFIIIVTLSAVYGKIMDDFSSFTVILPIFKAYQTEELRSYFQLTFQVLAIPFIFSTTLLRIAVDWLLLKKKSTTTLTQPIK